MTREDDCLRPAPAIPDHALIRRVGKGAYGEVWLARNVMGQFRAVKVVYREDFSDERPYEREFRGIQKFEPISRTHDSQVDILHIGRNDAEGYFYYVMELADDAQEISSRDPETSLIQSPSSPALKRSFSPPPALDPDSYVPKTLKLVLNRRGTLPLEECLEIGLSLTTALAHLHEHGLVHRDVKPSNIIFVNGLPKLADIGLVTDSDATISFVGTEGYVSPEGPGTPQADLYGLGMVLYESCSGKSRQDFPDPPTCWDDSVQEEALREFHEVLLKACERDIYKRYRDAREMRADLLVLQGGKSVRRLHALERRVTILTRAGIMGTTLLVLVTGAYLLALYKKKAERETIRAEASERTSQDRLWNSYLIQAHGIRTEGRAGHRFESLDLLAKAAAIRPSMELRTEAIAALTLADARPGRNLPDYPSGTNYHVFDKDFEHYAHGDPSGHVSVRRVKDDTEIVNLQGMSVPFEYQSLWISPNGEFVAAKYVQPDNNRLLLWKVASGEKILEFKSPTKEDINADFSADSRLAALCQFDGPIPIYDLQTGKERIRIQPDMRPVCVRFSPDSQTLAVSGYDRSLVKLYNIETGQQLGSLQSESIVECLEWRPDGEVLAGGSDGGDICIWSRTATQPINTLKGHISKTTNVAFDSSGDLVVSYSWDQTMRFWDPRLGKQIVEAPYGSQGLHFSSDDRWLGEASDGRKLFTLEVATGRECRLLGSHAGSAIWYATFEQQGRLLATSAPDGARLWDMSACRQVAFIPASRCAGAALHPDGRSLFISSDSGLQRWPIEREDQPQQLAIRIGPPRETIARGFIGPMVSNDGQRLSAIDRAVARVWDLGGQTHPIQVMHRSVASAVFSPDGRWLVTGTWHGSEVAAKVWDAQTGAFQADLPVYSTANVQFTPDGHLLITATSQEYQFWEVGSWNAKLSIPRQNARKDLAGLLSVPTARFSLLSMAEEELTFTKSLTVNCWQPSIQRTNFLLPSLVTEPGW